MALVLSEEHRLLRDTAAEFLENQAPVSALRSLRDEKDATGYSEELWQQMTELGWAGITLPEEYGGLEFGFLGLGTVLEQTGRTLTASPLFATAVLGASAIQLGGSPEQKRQYLPEIASGGMTVALAMDEGPHHRPEICATTATAVQDGYALNGSKQFVVDGHSADYIVIVARTAGELNSVKGLSLFIVPADIQGLSRERTQLMDSRNAATLTMENLVIPGGAMIGDPGEAWSILEPTLDRGRVTLAAEMLGSALEVFERSVDYLKEREQFGVKIGNFQALQHRAADLACQLELARSVVLQALSTVDENPAALAATASLAKCRMNDLARLVTNEAVQMHGGIGVTDELEIGFFLKRARVTAQLLGDSSYHRRRFAQLNGF